MVGKILSENHGIKSTQYTSWSYPELKHEKRHTDVSTLAHTMSKATAFTVYKTTNKISPVQHMELLEYIMAANHGLLEKGEVF